MKNFHFVKVQDVYHVMYNDTQISTCSTVKEAKRKIAEVKRNLKNSSSTQKIVQYGNHLKICQFKS